MSFEENNYSVHSVHNVAQRLDSRTVAFALLGNPVSHSLSPLMYNAAFTYCGLNCCYLAFTVESHSLSSAVDGIRAMGWGGFNVTAPHKEAIIPYLDGISEEAEFIRSVNTVVNREGSLYGYTTDGVGLCRFLQEDSRVFPEKHRVLLLGAGGAARAVAFSLVKRGIKGITIANRNRGKAEDMADMLKKNFPLTDVRVIYLLAESLEKELADNTLIINTLNFDAPPLIEAIISYGEKRANMGKRFMVDLRYNPEKTALMQKFCHYGGEAYNGKGMLWGQAVHAFEYFIPHMEAPADVMRLALNY